MRSRPIENQSQARDDVWRASPHLKLTSELRARYSLSQSAIITRALGGRSPVTDTVTREKRSLIMARVRAKNTTPERAIRRLVSGMGYKYRLHVPDLPGKPDLVFPKSRRVIMVHGCYWHRHSHCPLARIPKSNRKFWLSKLEGNRARDQRNNRTLRRKGWRILTVWECQLGDSKLRQKVGAFLASQY
jgi:DNA mismatch endonuclease (patch repair protein)